MNTKLFLLCLFSSIFILTIRVPSVNGQFVDSSLFDEEFDEDDFHSSMAPRENMKLPTKEPTKVPVKEPTKVPVKVPNKESNEYLEYQPLPQPPHKPMPHHPISHHEPTTSQYKPKPKPQRKPKRKPNKHHQSIEKFKKEYEQKKKELEKAKNELKKKLDIKMKEGKEKLHQKMDHFIKKLEFGKIEKESKTVQSLPSTIIYTRPQHPKKPKTVKPSPIHKKPIPLKCKAIIKAIMG